MQHLQKFSKKTCLFFLLITQTSFGLSIFDASLSLESPHRIRIRVMKDQDQVKIRGFDLRIYERGTGKSELFNWKQALWQRGVAEWSVSCSAGRVLIQNNKDSYPKIFEAAVTFVSPGGFIKSGQHPFREELRIIAHQGKCDVLNVVDIEKYLGGIVNSEFSSRWSKEAVDAQVVAARTYAYYQMTERRKAHSEFDVETTIADQQYDGPLKEDHLAAQSVERTRGSILMADGRFGKEPMKAFYHSTCGGKTELPQNVWGEKHAGFKQSVACRFCKSSPAFTWRLSLPEGELQDRLRNGFKESPRLNRFVPSLKSLASIQMGSLSPSGRVYEVLTIWKSISGSEVVLPVTSNQLRKWVGSGELKSALFNVERKHSQWTFRGVGNGHGVGLCQWGAKEMGSAGYKSLSILKHYYPQASLKKLW